MSNAARRVRYEERPAAPPREAARAEAPPAARPIPRRALFLGLAGLDLFAGLAATLGVGAAYNFAVYGWLALNAPSLRLGLFVALTFVAIQTARQSYGLARYLNPAGHAGRIAAYWNLAFMLAAFLGFLERADAQASRGAFMAAYAAGFLALYGAHMAAVEGVRRLAAAGRLPSSRVMIVGYHLELERLARRHALEGAAKSIVERCVLSGDPAALAGELAAATRRARRRAIDEVLIAAPMARADIIDRCVRAFLQAPVALSVHLEPGSALAHFSGAQVAPMGAGANLRLPPHSASGGDLALKRAFDIVGACLGLVLALPLMAGLALAIKWESPGPVFFTQIRYGYNKRPFRIFKFRTMTAMESGRHVTQATRNDFRVTGMGRFMRRFNVDELPQLVNVLRGEMSLVGPRPHAISHDRHFSKRIDIYERRHNIRPGITGWAQVNGLRGPTDTLEKIEQRVRFDLHYIDHWTLGLDLRILVLTLFSRTAYRNAF